MISDTTPGNVKFPEHLVTVTLSEGVSNLIRAVGALHEQIVVLTEVSRAILEIVEQSAVPQDDCPICAGSGRIVNVETFTRCPLGCVLR